MKKYKLLKPFSFLKRGAKIYATFETKIDGIYTRNFAKIYTKNRKYVGELEFYEKYEWFIEIRPKPNNVWDLKDGDIYYSLGAYNIMENIWESKWYNNRGRNYGYCFLTRREAQKEIEKRKAIQKIKKYCCENNIDTKYNNEAENSYCFNLNNIGKVVFFDDFRNGNTLGYFSRKNAQKILDNFEEELKIILN